jgi:hypothetical protein
MVEYVISNNACMSGHQGRSQHASSSIRLDPVVLPTGSNSRGDVRVASSATTLPYEGNIDLKQQSYPRTSRPDLHSYKYYSTSVYRTASDTLRTEYSPHLGIRKHHVRPREIAERLPMDPNTPHRRRAYASHCDGGYGG